jgi:hypothetical protein
MAKSNPDLARGRGKPLAVIFVPSLNSGACLAALALPSLPHEPAVNQGHEPSRESPFIA